MSIFDKVFRFLASIRLAVIIIIGLGVISAVGTIYEARYDARFAQQVVYHSLWMWLVLGALCVNLIAVMVDRWPWKKHHSGFVLAHIGIILMLLGSVFTKFYGVDGSISFDIGKANRYVTLPEHELAVYSSYAGGRVTELFKEDVDFFKNPPTEDKPHVIELDGKKITVKQYYHYGVRSASVVPSTLPSDGPGVRFQLQNDRVNFSEWLIRGAKKSHESINMGPARVILSDGSYKYTSGNEVILEASSDSDQIKYSIHTASKGGKGMSGVAKAGDAIETGWMGLTLRILRFLPRAREEVSYTKEKYPNKVTHPAIQMEYEGQNYWMALNSVLRFYDSDKVYILTFGNKRLDIGFDLKLVRFNMDKYQGTNRAATYESDVLVPGVGEVNISMNEPLKHNGFTFYQASFEQDDSGAPTTSILSVNYDPGRGMKYLGSLLLVIGSIMLFYFKRGFKFFKKKGA